MKYDIPTRTEGFFLQMSNKKPDENLLKHAEERSSYRCKFRLYFSSCGIVGMHKNI